MTGRATRQHLSLRAGRGTPLSVAGRYRTAKTAIAAILLSFFAVTPWLRWDRGPGLPDQAVLFDIAGRRMFMFDVELWPQDLPISVFVLVGSAAALFAATAVNGRVWCGFACPQTVWTDLFFAVERRLGRAHRGLRHPLFAIVGFVTGFTFVGWFTDIVALPSGLATGTADTAVYVTIGLLTMATWLLGGVVREKVCIAMCPWPRFQTALIDLGTRVVTYDDARGEPRGRRRLPLRADLVGSSVAEPGGAVGDPGRGDCIDCGRCVAVCPTQVDIRDGLQIGCIGCGLCVDACDAVMDKVQRPRGLIRFAAEERGARALRRPTPMIYGTVAITCAIICVVLLFYRPLVAVSIEQARGQPFVLLSDGSVRNDLSVSVSHRLPGLDAVHLSIEEHPQANVSVAGGGAAVLHFAPDRQVAERVFVTFAPDQSPSGVLRATLVVADARGGDELARLPVQLAGPSRRP